MPKHRHQEWIKFLQLIRQRTPADKRRALIMTTTSAHKIPRAESGWPSSPAFTFTSPPPVFLAQHVERFFRALTDKCFGGRFHDVNELEQAIHHYIDRHIRNPAVPVDRQGHRHSLEKVKRGLGCLRARGMFRRIRVRRLQSIDRPTECRTRLTRLSRCFDANRD